MIGTQDLSDIYKPIKQDLNSFNEMIQKELTSKDRLIQSIHEYLLGVSGKQLRPALAIICARLSGDTSDVPIRLALAIELLHTATLIHDDIIDSSMYRRNQLSMNAKWGTEISIICGDYLYAKAFQVLSVLDDSNINKMFAQCARTMCEGEMKQVEARENLEITEEAYIEIILKKTASLFQAACAVGGYVAKQPANIIHCLSEYGKNFGLAFQIVDDCLDIIGEEEHLGKKTGIDFKKSDPTLPLIHLYQTMESHQREKLMRLIGSVDSNEKIEYFRQIKPMFISTGAVDKCIERAKSYASQAFASARELPDSVYRKSLLDLLDYTLQRV